MIDDFAHEFWKDRARATTSSIRWTDEQMLAVDVALLDSLTEPGSTLLDLGCGTGDLFLALLDKFSHVTAVDMIPEFLERIPEDPRITTVVSELTSYRPDGPSDVATLFGVVTHLTPEQEAATYRLLRDAAPDGLVVVKNQCGRDDDVEVDAWSEAFGRRYVGRYPQVDRQAERLREVFGSVEVVRYPEELNRWENSLHAAFVCR
ncbi:trans-aconitate 2-methyltransferase [Cellulomonas sp. PS-H5]|uniref:class I SAM-dependent methyltransferase n=1 Tax=Cellulomonas sp. PS-H5 TaxID=2820400 RepID=UPI001C4E9047|nr:class I SAM-dependent methyltransferase [Cellulomonas sp. PS-H5]MBW0255536.1 methyltransferase domain-containing protein [Cellulomonas sp. PS-H5]